MHVHVHTRYNDVTRNDVCCVFWQGQHIGTKELEEMGRKFSESLSKIKSRHMKPGAATGTPGSKITPTQSTSANMDQLQADGFASSPGAG